MSFDPTGFDWVLTGIGGMLGLIGGLWLKSQGQLIDLMSKMVDRDVPDPNGNGAKHTQTHMLLGRIESEIVSNREEFALIRFELRQLNDHLRAHNTCPFGAVDRN